MHHTDLCDCCLIYKEQDYMVDSNNIFLILLNMFPVDHFVTQLYIVKQAIFLMIESSNLRFGIFDAHALR